MLTSRDYIVSTAACLIETAAARRLHLLLAYHDNIRRIIQVKTASMYLDRHKFTFKKKRRDRPGRIAAYLILIAAGIFIVRQRQNEAIAPPFVPTPTATRSAISFAREAEAHFSSGKLERAISAYNQATHSDPNNYNLVIKNNKVGRYSRR